MRPASMYAYIGHCPKCGRVHAMTMDIESDKKAVAKDVARMITGGLNVERVTLDEANNADFGECVLVPRNVSLFGDF